MNRQQIAIALEEKRRLLKKFIVKKDSSQSIKEYESYLVQIWQVRDEINELKALEKPFKPKELPHPDSTW